MAVGGMRQIHIERMGNEVEVIDAKQSYGGWMGACGEAGRDE